MRDNRLSFSADDTKRKVIFLDIDGVMQPTNQRTHGRRFRLGRERLDGYPNTIADLTGIDHLRTLDKFDVAAVHLDWERDAIYQLKKLLNASLGSIEIVLSSGWRDTRSFEDMKALFQIHDLDEYLTDMCPVENFCSKERAISLYLEEHPMLEQYVILDDEYLGWYFPGRAIYCNKEWLDEKTARKAWRVLEHGPWWNRTAVPQECVPNEYDTVLFFKEEGFPAYSYRGRLVDPETQFRFLPDLIQKTDAEIVYTGKAQNEVCEALKQKSGRLEFTDQIPVISHLSRYRLDLADITLESSEKGSPAAIEKWLKDHPGVQHYAILDDDSNEDHWGDLWKHVVNPPKREDDMGAWEWGDLYEVFYDRLLLLLGRGDLVASGL